MLSREKLFPYFIGGVIIALPVVIRVSTHLHDVVHGKNHLFASLVVLSLLFFGFARKVPVITATTIGIWFTHAYFNQVDFLNPFVFYQYVCFGLGMLLFAQGIANFKRDDNTVIINSMAIAALIQGCWIVGEYLFAFDASDFYNLLGYNLLTTNSAGVAIAGNNPGVITGSLTNPNYSGALLALCSISLFRKGWLFGIPLVVVSFILLGSVLPIISVGIGSVVYFLLKFKVKFRYVLLISVILSSLLGAVSYLSNQTGYLGASGRVEAWKSTVVNSIYGHKVNIRVQKEEEIVEKEVEIGKRYMLGHGLGYFSSVSKYFIKEKINRGQIWRQVHNEYLEVFYAFGAVGILYIIALLRPIFLLRNVDPILFGTFGALAFNSIGHFTFHISSTAFLGIILISLLYNQKENNYEEDTIFSSFGRNGRFALRN